MQILDKLFISCMFLLFLDATLTAIFLEFPQFEMNLEARKMIFAFGNPGVFIVAAEAAIPLAILYSLVKSYPNVRKKRILLIKKCLPYALLAQGIGNAIGVSTWLDHIFNVEILFLYTVEQLVILQTVIFFVCVAISGTFRLPILNFLRWLWYLKIEDRKI